MLIYAKSDKITIFFSFRKKKYIRQLDRKNNGQKSASKSS